MLKKSLVLVSVLLLIAAVTTSQASQATFDMNYITSMTVTGQDPDAVIVYGPDEVDFSPNDDDGQRFCQGILKYRNKQEVSNTVTEGWAWGYFAVQIPDVSETDCTWLDDNAKPSFVYLHPYGPKNQDGTGGTRGSLQMARGLALLTGGFVLGISAPGQGYDCSLESGKDECVKYGYDQISNGDPMSSQEMREGFADAQFPHPERSMLYGYAHSGMRAVTVANELFGENGPAEVNGWTDGDVVVAGISGGGVTTLIINGVDSRLDGAIAFAASGALADSIIQPGNWLAHNTTSDLQTPLETIDCSDPENQTATTVCNMISYMDPINYTPQNPVIMITGAQDEDFPVRATKRTRDTYLSNAPNQKIFMYLVSDMDHNWYMNLLLPLHPCKSMIEAYAQPYQNHGFPNMLNTIEAFFAKAVNDDLADFGDKNPTVTMAVTQSGLVKTYTTTIKVATAGRAPQNAQIGFTGTNFWHVYPGMTAGEVDTSDIEPMTYAGTCETGKACYTFASSYSLWGQPSYYGSFGQANYAQNNYGGDANKDLEWHLTSDVVSAGTGGYTALTFPQTFRCPSYPIVDWQCTCGTETPEDVEEQLETNFFDSL